MRRWCSSCFYHEVFNYTGKKVTKNGKIYRVAECQCCRKTIYIFQMVVPK